MLGQTTPGVMRLREALVRAGHEPVIFHANGVGGPAMEHLCEEGALQGVVDYTLSELANSLMDGIHADRARSGCASPAASGSPRSSSPAASTSSTRARATPCPSATAAARRYFHNPVATLVRLDRDEEARLGALIAERLNECAGPVRVVAPTRGFSLADAEGGDLWDPVADGAFLDALRGHAALRHPLRGRRRPRRRPRVRRRRRRALPALVTETADV